MTGPTTAGIAAASRARPTQQQERAADPLSPCGRRRPSSCRRSGPRSPAASAAQVRERRGASNKFNAERVHSQTSIAGRAERLSLLDM